MIICFFIGLLYLIFNLITENRPKIELVFILFGIDMIIAILINRGGDK